MASIQRQIHTAIITGPTGAIGMALCAKLLAEGVTVYAVTHPGSARAALLPQDARLHVVPCDAAELAALGRPRALLVPLLLAAGDHAKNDMAGPAPGSLRARLEAAGLRTACVLGGLGRLDGIRALYVRRALQAAGGLD